MRVFSVSVVIPTFNGDNFIEATLQSVVSQSVPVSEIIVVDDASTDETLDRVYRFSESSSVPVRIERLASNSGSPVLPINRGISLAKGDWIALLDQDDLWQPNRIQLSIEAIQAFPKGLFVLGDYNDFDESGVISGSDAYARSKSEWPYSGHRDAVMLDASDLLYFYRHIGLQHSCSNHFFKKTCWQTIGGYRSDAGFAADYDFILRVYRLGVIWVPQKVFLKRVHGNNTWVDTTDSTLLTLRIQVESARCCDRTDVQDFVKQRVFDNTRGFRWEGNIPAAISGCGQLFKSRQYLRGISELARLPLSSLARMFYG